MMKELVGALLILVSVAADTVTYEGYKVYEVQPKSFEENKALQDLQSNGEYDFWTDINKVGNPVLIMVSPQNQYAFQNYLLANGISNNIIINNVENTIESERQHHHQQRKSLQHGRISFDQYQRHDAINAYLEQIAKENPSRVKLTTIGKSYENRTINLVRISSGGAEKPVLFIEGGMHAREWISPAFTLYIINQLLENPVYTEKLDWIVLPVVNPDGYEYTWTTNRMWRKTRSLGRSCDGTDGNRNFGFHWMEQGASSNECSETYAGPSAFSEIEARNLRDILDKVNKIAGFVSVHSYGQYLFYPYSYNNVVPSNWRFLQEIAQAAGAAISAVNGTKYQIGASTEVLYPAAGCSDDWAMGGAGIDIVLTFELPGGGSQGFDLPASRILPVARETWEGVKVIADYVAQSVQ